MRDVLGVPVNFYCIAKCCYLWPHSYLLVLRLNDEICKKVRLVYGNGR